MITEHHPLNTEKPDARVTEIAKRAVKVTILFQVSGINLLQETLKNLSKKTLPFERY